MPETVGGPEPLDIRRAFADQIAEGFKDEEEALDDAETAARVLGGFGDPKLKKEDEDLNENEKVKKTRKEINTIKERWIDKPERLRARLLEMQRQFKGNDEVSLAIFDIIQDEIDFLVIPEKVNVDKAESEYTVLINWFGSKKRLREAAATWLAKYTDGSGNPKNGISADMVTRVEKIREGEIMELNEEQKARLVAYCLDNVFDRDKKNAYTKENILGTLLGPSGWLHVELNIELEDVESMREGVVEIVNGLNIENWIAVRENVSNWNRLKNTEEVKPGILTESLFLSDSVEKFFGENKDVPDGKRRILIPKEVAGGGVVVEEVDSEREISLAMKIIFDHFSAPGNGDYWGLLGKSDVDKLKLFEQLGINKYVGEVAFSIMLSHNILTETSSDDIFAMMVKPSKKRPSNWKVNESRDFFVRMFVQEELAAGRPMPTTEQQERWVAQNLPMHFIPTGLTGEGRENLTKGNWLKWRVEENINSPKMTAPDVRAGMMQDALSVLTTIKDIGKPDSAVSMLPTLLSMVMKWGRADLKGVGWAQERVGADGSKGLYIDPELCPAGPDGRPIEMESFDWGGRIMLTVAKAFIYTHSVLDRDNKKPLDFGQLAEAAKEALAVKVQGGKGEALGLSMDMELKREEKLEFVRFMDRVWGDMKGLTKSYNPKKIAMQNAFGLPPAILNLFGKEEPPEVTLPSWWNNMTPLGPEQRLYFEKNQKSNAWPDIRNAIRV